ncbi:dihydrodipicolinate synthase family protein [Amycolatopsis nigrescens]|uniref:dihydrodipicolinate synthase family protein n=1 Tax=Amycolatopsis nigrescens TaxID=381445 RepID=UPI000369D1CB|nr:dihydrodipicolinate synthase family protein [Amycolatopsis nigrescens]
MADYWEALSARLAGVVAIPVTPFDQAGAVDERAYTALIERLVGAGIGVLTPNGNTGEFYALSEAETRTCVELTARAAGSRAVVLAGVGHDVAGAISGAEHAREAGAELVMVHQPVHPYVSTDGWVAYHRAIAEAVPDLGVVPYLRNPAIDGSALAELGAACPNVLGVKYAVPDPVRFASVARDAGLSRFVWIAGLAELSAPGYFAVGATGFTSGLVNVHPAASLRMFDALTHGDFAGAMKVWERIRPFEELRAANSSAANVSVVKDALARLGLCRPDVRPPSTPLSPGDGERVAALLKTWELAPVAGATGA